MRAKAIAALVLVGAVALFLGPTPGLTQFPGGGPPGGGQWGSRRGGFDGGGRRGGMRGDPNQFFNMLSGGKDVIVRAELTQDWQQRMFDRFAQATGNTTGQLTREQYLQAAEQMRGQRMGSRPPDAAPAPGTPPGQAPAAPAAPGGFNNGDMFDRWAEGSFRRYDANGDGLLNYDEMPEALRSERDKWDTNKDGFIDLNEYKAYFRAVMQERMAERGGGPQDWGGTPWPAQEAVPAPAEEDKRPVVYRAGKLPKELPAWFAQIDTDKDGQIGLYEWRAANRPIAEFLAMDRNGDGFLTVEEVLRYENQKKTELAKNQQDDQGNPVMAVAGAPGGMPAFGGGMPGFGRGRNGGFGGPPGGFNGGQRMRGFRGQWDANGGGGGGRQRRGGFNRNDAGGGGGR